MEEEEEEDLMLEEDEEEGQDEEEEGEEEIEENELEHDEFAYEESKHKNKGKDLRALISGSKDNTEAASKSEPNSKLHATAKKKVLMIKKKPSDKVGISPQKAGRVEEEKIPFQNDTVSTRQALRSNERVASTRSLEGVA